MQPFTIEGKAMRQFVLTCVLLFLAYELEQKGSPSIIVAYNKDGRTGKTEAWMGCTYRGLTYRGLPYLFDIEDQLFVPNDPTEDCPGVRFFPWTRPQPEQNDKATVMPVQP